MLLCGVSALLWGDGGVQGPGRGDKQVFVQGSAHLVCALTSYQWLRLQFTADTHTPGKVTPYSPFL